MPLISKFERDEDGWRSAVADSRHMLVSSFLEQDVQGDPEWCTKLLETIDSVASEVLPKWEGTGNAHHVILDQDTATIECIWAEEVPLCSVPLQEFREAVVG